MNRRPFVAACNMHASHGDGFFIAGLFMLEPCVLSGVGRSPILVNPLSDRLPAKSSSDPKFRSFGRLRRLFSAHLRGTFHYTAPNGSPGTDMQQNAGYVKRQAITMRFTSSVVAPQEARLGRSASAVLSGSIVLLVAFLLFVGASISSLWLTASAAAAAFIAYLVQVHYLSTIGRHIPQRRLRTWQLSLVAHGIVFAVCCLLVRDSVVFVLLIPEALSALIHLVGIRCARKALGDTRPSIE